MKEYTLLSLLSVFIAIKLDIFLKTKIMREPIFWLFILVIACFKIIVNGFLTSNSIVVYNPSYFLGLRLGSIPLEDFLFGFSMVSSTVILWEYFKRKQA